MGQNGYHLYNNDNVLIKTPVPHIIGGGVPVAGGFAGAMPARPGAPQGVQAARWVNSYSVVVSFKYNMIYF